MGGPGYKDSLGFPSVRFRRLVVVQNQVCCPLHSKSNQAKRHSTHRVRGPVNANEGMGGGGQVDRSVTSARQAYSHVFIDLT